MCNFREKEPNSKSSMCLFESCIFDTFQCNQRYWNQSWRKIIWYWMIRDKHHQNVWYQIAKKKGDEKVFWFVHFIISSAASTNFLLSSLQIDCFTTKLLTQFLRNQINCFFKYLPNKPLMCGVLRLVLFFLFGVFNEK